jgi:hypothetical protein
MTNADLARSLADKLDDCAIPHEYELPVRLTLLHLGRVCGDPHFLEELALLRDMLAK